MAENKLTQNGITTRLASKGFWAAIANKCLSEGKYSKAVEICKEKITEEPEFLSGKLIYAKALFWAGQMDSAETVFYHILSRDPENVVAMKFLGDIKYGRGEQVTALIDYNRILEIDPYCQGLFLPIKKANRETTKTITFVKPTEKITEEIDESKSIKEILFYTETMGDLYLKQGHPRLAAEIFRKLQINSDNPILEEKLEKAKLKIKEKELKQ